MLVIIEERESVVLVKTVWSNCVAWRHGAYQRAVRRVLSWCQGPQDVPFVLHV
jgi:hypothetical protein